MSKRILYLSFYFEPDLCAGSFRNTPLIKELVNQIGSQDVQVDLVTTQPNRYGSYNLEAKAFEERGHLNIYRAHIPKHKSGFTDQIFSFIAFYKFAIKVTKDKNYDLVIGSSSRLFTAFLARRISFKNQCPLYLDIRDIFYDTMKDVLKNPILRILSLPVISKIENYTIKKANHVNLISGGFKSYFSEKYKLPNYSFFSNGIDDEFLKLGDIEPQKNKIPIITYAGNFGEGQGLHKIIPIAAKILEGKFRFLLIGDGGTKKELIESIKKNSLNNVEIRNPINRTQLLEVYKDSDYLFIHLNDYDAFKKVLPSKVFELAAFQQPIIAGVGGFAADFMKNEVENLILFEPGNAKQLAEKLTNYQYKLTKRQEFLDKFQRSKINRELAESMMSYL
jgi:hypothetical protein